MPIWPAQDLSIWEIRDLQCEYAFTPIAYNLAGITIRRGSRIYYSHIDSEGRDVWTLDKNVEPKGSPKDQNNTSLFYLLEDEIDTYCSWL